MAYEISDVCTNCALCVSNCPVGAISQGGSSHKIDPNVCINCGACAAICPVGAPKCI